MAQQALESQPLLLSSSDSPVVHGNEDRIRAEILVALADASIDQLVLAQTRLESLLSDAPNNSDLRHELANVYRSRGWLDGALFEYDQVLTMNDKLTYARVGKAHTQIDAQQFAAVDETVKAARRLGKPRAPE